MTRVLLTAVLAISFASPAISQAPQQQQGMRERGERMCGRDASRVCKDVIAQGDFAVLACFQENAKRLSQPCHDFLVEAGQIWPAK